MAAQCRHYAMCKIDYLGTGLCPAGAEKPYVSYFPQGRMDLYHALSKGLLGSPRPSWTSPEAARSAASATCSATS